MIDKQTQLAWLDKQRSIVNDMIVNLPPDEQKQLMPELQVINAITERVNEMTAVEYLEAKTEMCDSDWNAASCNRCELRGSCEERGCAYFEQEHPFLSVEIVRKWKEEHNSD